MDLNGGVFIILCEAPERPAIRCSDGLDLIGGLRADHATD
jgi:hypothetical protein